MLFLALVLLLLVPLRAVAPASDPFLLLLLAGGVRRLLNSFKKR